MTELEFLKLPWHETRLVELRLGRQKTNAAAEVVIDLRFPNAPRTSRLAFAGCTFIVMKCDLDYMRVMGDVINTVSSAPADDLASFLQEPVNVQNLRKYTISLMPPSGVIEIYATNVSDAGHNGDSFDEKGEAG